LSDARPRRLRVRYERAGSKLLLGHRSGRRQDDTQSDRFGTADAQVEADETAKGRRQRLILIATSIEAFGAIPTTMPLAPLGHRAGTIIDPIALVDGP
jgi:hypothetical protein